MRFKFLTLLIAVVMFSCSDDSVSDPDDSIMDEEMMDEDMNELSSVLFTANVSDEELDADNRRLFYFITDVNNVAVGDYVSFDDGILSKEVLRPDGFEDEVYNVHRLEVTNLSVDPNTQDNLRVLLTSYINTGETTRNSAPWPGIFGSEFCENTNTEFSTQFVFDNLPEHSQALIGSGCGVTVPTLPIPDPDVFPTVIDIFEINRSVFIHFRDSDSIGHYVILENLEEDVVYTINESDLSSEMTLITPLYNMENLLLRVGQVFEEGRKNSKLRIFSGLSAPGNDIGVLDNYFVPSSDSTSLYFATSLSAVVNGDNTSTVHKSGYYHRLNETPDLTQIVGTIERTGSFLQWQYNTVGAFDAVEITIRSRDDDINGNTINRLDQKIYHNDPNYDYEFPTIPEGISDLYPSINQNFIINNEDLTTEILVHDVEEITTYQDYLDALLSKNSIPNSATLLDVNRKEMSRFYNN